METLKGNTAYQESISSRIQRKDRDARRRDGMVKAELLENQFLGRKSPGGRRLNEASMEKKYLVMGSGMGYSPSSPSVPDRT
jgi:hypothetical protein